MINNEHSMTKHPRGSSPPDNGDQRRGGVPDRLPPSPPTSRGAAPSGLHAVEREAPEKAELRSDEIERVSDTQ